MYFLYRPSWSSPTSAPSKSLSIKISSLTNTLGQVRILVGFLAIYIAVNIPAGSPVHYPVEKIYSEKIVSAITNKDEQNVAGVSFCSIWDYLMFSYSTKLVFYGNVAE